MSLPTLRRRLYIGVPDYLVARKAPKYRLRQLQYLGLCPVGDEIYPTGLAALDSGCCPSLPEVDQELVHACSAIRSSGLIGRPFELGKRLSGTLGSIRTCRQRLAEKTLLTLGQYTVALYRQRDEA